MHELYNHISKRVQWCDDLSIVGGRKLVVSQEQNKNTFKINSESPSTYKVQELVVEELIRGMKDLSLQVAKLQEKGPLKESML